MAWEISQIGVTEQPPGSNLQPYGVDYGWNGVAWCQIFQWDAQVHAGDKNFFKTAATTACAAYFQRNGAWLAPGTTRPPRGSLIFFDWGKGIAHVGRVEGTLADGRIATIEGNTDYAGGGSGGRVMRQNRGANIAGYGLITFMPVTTAPISQDTDMPLSFLLQASEADDTAGVFLTRGDFSSQWHVPNMTVLKDLVFLNDHALPETKFLQDDTIHRLPGEFVHAIPTIGAP